MEQINYTLKENQTQAIRMVQFNHLTYQDRIFIQQCLDLKDDPNYVGEKITICYIAKRLGVNKSTVSREIKRGTFKDINPKNGQTYYHYLASYGQGTYDKNSKRSHYKRKLEKNSEELKELTVILNSGSDVLTAFYLYQKKHNKKFPICEKSVYNYFHRGDIVLKRGSINPRKRVQKAKKEQKTAVKGDSIELRDEKINNRSEFGHWEGDLVIGKKGEEGHLFTLIERKTRLYMAFKIQTKEMKCVVEALNQIESSISIEKFKEIFKSITFDNGTEFKDFEGMSKSITDDTKRTKIYYAHAYCSFERGSNENGNRMLRKYFPKGTSFKNVSMEEILQATNKINFSIRRLLGKKSAADTLKKLNESFYDCIEILGLKDPYSNYLGL